MSTPLKMSLFSTISNPSTGSFFIGVDSGSSGTTNTKISSANMAAFVTRSLYSTAPATSNDAGSQGAMAVDSNYFYVYTNSKWRRISLGSLF